MVSLNRVVMQKSSRRWIRDLDPRKLDVAEISGKWGEMFQFRSYRSFRYPEFDVCAGPFIDEAGKIQKFDLILANQVWEHLDRPYAATRNVRRMLKKGGHFWVAVPFYIPLHAAPVDNTRWSARGLKNLLIESGFDPDHIRSEEWGNRNAALRNMEEIWPPVYDAERDSLDKDPEMPVCAWAMAQRT